VGYVVSTRDAVRHVYLIHINEFVHNEFERQRGLADTAGTKNNNLVLFQHSFCFVLVCLFVCFCFLQDIARVLILSGKHFALALLLGSLLLSGHFGKNSLRFTDTAFLFVCSFVRSVILRIIGCPQ
jgi:hypothetical protein